MRMQQESVAIEIEAAAVDIEAVTMEIDAVAMEKVSTPLQLLLTAKALSLVVLSMEQHVALAQSTLEAPIVPMLQVSLLNSVLSVTMSEEGMRGELSCFNVAVNCSSKPSALSEQGREGGRAGREVCMGAEVKRKVCKGEGERGRVGREVCKGRERGGRRCVKGRERGEGGV